MTGRKGRRDCRVGQRKKREKNALTDKAIRTMRRATKLEAKAGLEKAAKAASGADGAAPAADPAAAPAAAPATMPLSSTASSFLVQMRKEVSVSIVGYRSEVAHKHAGAANPVASDQDSIPAAAR
uniref:Uncharacterized protein n=1 Tax=Haptolina ericina TaxID=156174 RepID=A0A7S3BGZ4_9EUKA